MLEQMVWWYPPTNLKLDEAPKDLIVDSAMASSSRVEMPGLMAAFTAAKACAVINPAARMAIMSELDFSEIRSRAKIILKELGLGRGLLENSRFAQLLRPPGQCHQSQQLNLLRNRPQSEAESALNKDSDDDE